ncbi:MAG: hypothetical protein LUF35_13905 [Lachnospiraceae bacterium]|nr:hypothetical protein [Lachnospiraceae bacterium]
MVKGLDVFREYFEEFSGQYTLIGGAACDISFEQNEVSFRATRDLDIVLIVEAQTKEFGQRFWRFVQDGKYMRKAKSDGSPQFYRFEKPAEPGFPLMIELFARSEWLLQGGETLTPIHIDDSVSSLSAILLNDEYYEALLMGRDVVGGISILKPTWLVPFKAKAWLEMAKKQENGEHVDSRDVKKHRNDILRIVSELILEPCHLPEKVHDDMEEFCAKLTVTDEELENLKLKGIHEADIKKILTETYGLNINLS